MKIEIIYINKDGKARKEEFIPCTVSNFAGFLHSGETKIEMDNQIKAVIASEEARLYREFIIALEDEILRKENHKNGIN